jgi:hypothetical protein
MESFNLMENKFLFIGEERSPRAIQMNVTWRDKRLCAGHLYKALKNLGICWDKVDFMNVFEDDITNISSHPGIKVAMGRKVQRELSKHNIEHEFIYHPAARGEIRAIDKYIAHVKEQLHHLV